MLIQATYQLTEKDFQEAQVQHTGALGRMVRLIGWIAILSALPALLMRQYVQAILGFVVGTMLTFGTRLSVKRTFRKESSLQLEATTVISEEGLVIRTPRSEGKLHWNAFVRYTETKNIFVLYVQSRVFYIIPKRAFSAEDLVALRQILSRGIQAPAVHPGSSNVKVFLFALVVAAAVVLVYLAIHANHR